MRTKVGINFGIRIDYLEKLLNEVERRKNKGEKHNLSKELNWILEKHFLAEELAKNI